ncbi:MAG TPA: winged helix-turn-helix domain-containing protein [Pyrinomonadaceae bacterium]|jgi:DNA-binding winged helix-turn-helix (wHTH) protein/TolB-like protein/Tfp pilus assembly protein PilF
MQKTVHQIYSFDEFSLDLTRGALLRGASEIKLRPKSFEVLRYLAENGGRLVTKDELIAAVWTDTAVTDDSLVQCLKDIRRALDDNGQVIIKTVPRRGYIFEKEVSETGAAVIYTEETAGVSLVIEETVEEYDDEKLIAASPRPRVSASAFIGAIRRHKLAAMVVSAVLIAVVIAGAFFSKPILMWWFKPPSIAVLPIFNSTGDAGQDYISDGLTESIITSLKQLNTPGKLPPRLLVSAQNTIFLFKNKELDPRAVGSQLGVDSVLASKMFLQNNLRHFKFELINVADGSVLWSKQYSVSWGNTFGNGSNMNDKVVAMQNEIPSDVAAQLRLGLSDAERQILTRRYTQNPEAYDLYLKGRAEFRLLTPSGLRKSIEYFEQAIDLDPNFATAYWAMGMAYRTQGLIDERSDKEANEKAAELFKSALKIDNTLALAVNALKYGDLDARDWKTIEKAGPSHPGYGFYLIASGRINEQLENEKRLLSFEPYAPGLNFFHCMTLFTARRYDESIAQCQKTLNISMDGKPRFGPESPWVHLQLGNAYCQKGMFPKAVDEINLAIEKAENSEAMRAVLGYTCAKAGQKDEALKILNLLNEQMSRGEYVPALNVAWIYSALGDKDQAFEWLNKAIDEGEDRLLYMVSEPELDGLRDDPRFPEMVRRIGFPN